MIGYPVRNSTLQASDWPMANHLGLNEHGAVVVDIDTVVATALGGHASQGLHVDWATTPILSLLHPLTRFTGSSCHRRRHP